MDSLCRLTLKLPQDESSHVLRIVNKLIRLVISLLSIDMEDTGVRASESTIEVFLRAFLFFVVIMFSQVSASIDATRGSEGVLASRINWRFGDEMLLAELNFNDSTTKDTKSTKGRRVQNAEVSLRALFLRGE